MAGGKKCGCSFSEMPVEHAADLRKECAVLRIAYIYVGALAACLSDG